MTDETDDLSRTVERIRASRFPDLDRDFLQAVLQAEAENPDSEAAALSAIQAAVKRVVARASD